ncbi:MAG: hypothetical protein HQ559_02340 [Lentisphaerae bacterium]|nr:hypothetical protein [Lentisphaerota bacterium]
MIDTTAEIEGFVRTIRRRNMIEMGVGLLMLLVFGRHAATAPAGSLELGGHLLIVVALVFVIGMLLFVGSTRGNLKTHPADDLTFWHAEILRQARLLRLVPYWYIAPFLPGFALLLWPLVPLFVRSDVWIERAVVGCVLVVIVAVTAAVGWLNARASAELAKKALSIRESETNQPSEASV